jgi:ribosome biogenesis GTPase
MALEELGYNSQLETVRKEQHLESFVIGRIIAEHKERYIVITETGEREAEITGNLRFAAKSREDFPAVGDWVALTPYDEDFAIIHKIFPRSSLIKREAVGHSGDIQIIATNIDYAFLVQAVDRDFNINRLERYLTICYESNVQPIIILTKTDRIDDQRKSEMIKSIQQRIQQVPVFAVSNETRQGYDALLKILEKGKTYCMLGSSGVGKSTLLNNLSGRDVMRTGAISSSTHKGRHVTSHRELIILEKGGLLIDNPGMREVGIADASSGLETTFESILNLGSKCRYTDCTHTHEKGCAVMEAVERGELDRQSYENYLKMEREKARFETTVSEKRRKEKIFGKIIKDYKKMNPKQR